MAKKVKAPIITGAVALQLRKKLKINQKDFWTPLGVTQSCGSRYEAGREIPKPVKILFYTKYMLSTDVVMSARDADAIAAIVGS